MKNQAKIPDKLLSRAEFLPESVNSEKRTAEVVWSTGAQVKRYDYWNDEYYMEELSMDSDSVNLERLNKGAPLLSDHNGTLQNTIGVVERAWLESNEGRATVRFSERDEVTDIFNDVKNGILRNISVGYKVKAYDVKRQDGELPIYSATDWEPMELSFVAIPADPNAQVRSSTNDEMITVRLIGDTDMTDTVEKETEKATKAESVVAKDVVEKREQIDSEALIRKAQESERKRISEIRAFGETSKAKTETIQRFIDDGTDVMAAKESMMKEWSDRIDSEVSRGDVAATVTADESEKRQEAAVNVLLAHAGKLPHEKRNEALQGNPFNGFSLFDFANDSAQRSGVNTTGMTRMDIVGRAFTQGTSDFPVLLENTMHKSLMGSYAIQADTWRRFCKTGSVSDFRAWKRLKTGSIGNLDSVNELGEFTNKAIPDGEAESIQATTKGNLINISRQAIINDDLGAFIGLTTDLGRAAARTIEAAVYAKIAANPAMGDSVELFHADHGNLASSGGAPTVATINAAALAMAQQMDISSNDYLDLEPEIVLAHRALRSTLVEVINAEYNDDATKNQRKPNSVRGIVNDIVTSSRLGTTTEWYLFANPAIAPVLEVVFLNGNESPYLEMQNGFTVDGVQYKVRLDFGVGVVDYRGAYKNAGA